MQDVKSLTFWVSSFCVCDSFSQNIVVLFCRWNQLICSTKKETLHTLPIFRAQDNKTKAGDHKPKAGDQTQISSI
jgi:hypothetical protein